MTGKKCTCTTKRTQTLLLTPRGFSKKLSILQTLVKICIQRGRSIKTKLTWLWEVLVTPHTVVTTDKEPGGWLVFCCQGTESYGKDPSLQKQMLRRVRFWNFKQWQVAGREKAINTWHYRNFPLPRSIISLVLLEAWSFFNSNVITSKPHWTNEFLNHSEAQGFYHKGLLPMKIKINSGSEFQTRTH